MSSKQRRGLCLAGVMYLMFGLMYEATVYVFGDFDPENSGFDLAVGLAIVAMSAILAGPVCDLLHLHGRRGADS